MDIVFLLFDEITALDAIGPCEVLARLPGARVSFAGPRAGGIRSDHHRLGLEADIALKDVPRCDLLLIPGGFGARKLANDAALVAEIVRLDRDTQITASVCTGALLLAATGLLRGRRATTHWAYFAELLAYGAEPQHERYVRDGKYATAAGVSAGIDLGLALALELAGKEVAENIQLSIEYDPAPPLWAGNPSRVSDAVRERLFRRSHARDAELGPAKL
jgi:transcriptional regulator GlxA family with amidase domain